jgi:hypothetical protein
MTRNTTTNWRFTSGAHVVTGDSPDELEANAISAAALLLAVPAGRLAVAQQYAIYPLSGDDSYLNSTQITARELPGASAGHTLCAGIHVGWPLPDADEPGPQPTRAALLAFAADVAACAPDDVASPSSLDTEALEGLALHATELIEQADAEQGLSPADVLGYRHTADCSQSADECRCLPATGERS